MIKVSDKTFTDAIGEPLGLLCRGPSSHWVLLTHQGGSSRGWDVLQGPMATTLPKALAAAQSHLEGMLAQGTLLTLFDNPPVLSGPPHVTYEPHGWWVVSTPGLFREFGSRQEALTYCESHYLTQPGVR